MDSGDFKTKMYAVCGIFLFYSDFVVFFLKKIVIVEMLHLGRF